MGVHDGHRERMRNRFLDYGIDNFDDHNVLEMLLFFSKARGDTNELAHRLIESFGSLSAVFDAPFEELLKVEGVGDNTALLIKYLPQAAKRYLMSKSDFDGILNTSERAGKYLLPKFFAERDEVVFLVCLDSKCKVLCCKKLFKGSVNSAGISVRKIVETAIAFNAASVILAHNHISGIAIPSKEDEMTTKRIENALNAIEIELFDHIVVANDDFISMADSGFFRR